MDERTTNLIGALVVALSDELDRAAPPEAGPTAAQAAALATVLSVPGVRVDGLAAVLGLTGSGAVRLVDRLVAAGLVERRRDGRDQRAVSLWLTADGDRVARDVVARRRAVVERALEPLGEQQRRTLGEAAEPVLAHLAGERARADRICRYCEYAVCPQDECPVEVSVP